MARVLHVSNISPFATKEQIQTMFAYVGRIEEFKLYPSDFALSQTTQQPKFAYIKYEDERGVEVGQHLTNTVFLDRALVCVPGQSNTIPDEDCAVQGGTLALPGQRQLPPQIVNQVQDIGEGQKMIVTIDPNLAALGLPAYPPLPPTTEPIKVEEIRRTVYVGNLPKGCDGEELLNFFNACIGEVMYLRMAAGNEYLPCDYAYVEFSQQSSVPLALQNSDSLEYQGRVLRIQHSKVAIIKPQRKTVEQSLEEVEEAIRGGVIGIGSALDLGRGYSPSKPGALAALGAAAAAAASITAAVLPPAARRDSPTTASSSSKKRSRSRKRSHSRSRKRSPSRSRSRSVRRRRSRSRSSSYSRRRSRSRRRSHSRRRTPSRTRERSSRKRSSSRRRSRSKKRSSVERSSKKKQRSRSRDRTPPKKEKESSGKASKRDKEREKEKSSGKREKEASSSSKKEASSSKKERKRSRSRSPKKPKAEREEKSSSSKKSKRTSEESSGKKAKKEQAPAEPTDEPAESTRTETTVDTPMDTTPPPPVEKAPKKEPNELEEEESLRERLLEKVKLKKQSKEEEE